ncbi:unnamed protein product [Rotaria socialis]|uniref:Uncharacterized protein n=1 Tax=Rotaria socialis TaxID=392032 RepID=A0A821ECP2_9BILA|nr:unnamed protein product [Rotaria socialis]
MIRQIIGLILSILAAVVMTLTCSFDTEELIDGDLAKSTGGKYKFLTILNLHLQAIYYYMCIVNFFFGSDTLTPEKCSLLQKIRDCIFAGLAFPVGMFVCITFWSLYHFDRELIFPEELDHLLPPIINHAMTPFVESQRISSVSVVTLRMTSAHNCKATEAAVAAWH